MRNWLTEVLRLGGFTMPAIYAVAAYGLFHWLDKKASGLAKKAISELLSCRRVARREHCSVS
jgi:hypothetical protein